MRKPQLVIDLSDSDAFLAFHDRLAAMGCPEASIAEAWNVVRVEKEGEYNTATRRLSNPAFAYAVKAMMSRCNAESPPPRQFTPLKPGEFAIEFEHRRLSPGKIEFWFRSGND